MRRCMYFSIASFFYVQKEIHSGNMHLPFVIYSIYHNATLCLEGEPNSTLLDAGRNWQRPWMNKQSPDGLLRTELDSLAWWSHKRVFDSHLVYLSAVLLDSKGGVLLFSNRILFIFFCTELILGFFYLWEHNHLKLAVDSSNFGRLQKNQPNFSPSVAIPADLLSY